MFGVGTAVDPELEFALMAAGVAPDRLYPLDIDKALASYDKIKNSVAKWWTTGAQPPQMLTDREVVMTTVWNGRMQELQKQGVPVLNLWNRASSGVAPGRFPKAAKNKVNAMKLAAFSTLPIPQARLSPGIPYGPVNECAFEYIPPARRAILASAPEIRQQLVPYNYDWWIANREVVLPKFRKWLLG